jgi:hypothetical protein
MDGHNHIEMFNNSRHGVKEWLGSSNKELRLVATQFPVNHIAPTRAFSMISMDRATRNRRNCSATATSICSATERQQSMTLGKAARSS